MLATNTIDDSTLKLLKILEKTGKKILRPVRFVKDFSAGDRVTLVISNNESSLTHGYTGNA